MAIIEALLLTTLLFSCGYASYFDLKKGIIPNKLILIAIVPVIIMDAVYYAVYAKEYFTLFIINFAVLCFLSIMMYALNLWAAGDSKLLFLIVLAIPGRLYHVNIENQIAPAIFIIVLTFSIAFIYVVAESIVLAIKSKEKISLNITTKQLVSFLKQYYCCFVYIMFINYTLSNLFPDFVSKNSSLITFCNLFFAIIIYRFKFFFRKAAVITVSILAVASVAVFYIRNPKSEPNIIVYVYLAILILIRFFAEKYNYKTINTGDVKPGMIMSYATVMMFAPSKIKGLPLDTTEDMRSRITAEEAESIIRWKDSKYGSDTVTIVRKIPFAIFMSIGSILYLILRFGALS